MIGRCYIQTELENFLSFSCYSESLYHSSSRTITGISLCSENGNKNSFVSQNKGAAFALQTARPRKITVQCPLGDALQARFGFELTNHYFEMAV